MKVESMFQAIFNAEVVRLYELASAGPLDMADIVKLEKLVGAHSKFRPSPTSEDDLAQLSTEELMNGLKSRSDPDTEAPGT